MDVTVIDTPQLGDRSYLVHDGEVALVIDAERDIDRVEAAVERADVRVTHVAETHIHNDYVTGGCVHARKHGAACLVNAADDVSFERTPIADGDTVRVGELSVKAVATPGHTHHHLSFAVEHGDEQAVFSGGSVLSGPVGRTDLLGREHMGPANAAGPTEPDLSLPDPLDSEELRSRLEAGEWVVDLRNRVACSSTHLTGTISFEYGDGSSFTTFLGWIFPYDRQLTLVGSREDVENSIRDLSRIGIDSPDAALGEDLRQLAPGAAVSSYPRVDWKGMLAERPEDETVLDVRRVDEYEESHLPGAVDIPLHELLTRMDEVSAGRLWVHCGSGYRSGVAASLLERAGRDAVHVDALFYEAEQDGVPLES